MALYSGRSKRWTLTERGRRDLSRDATSLSIGPSSLTWDANGLTAEIDETTVPLPSRVRGSIRLRPETVHEETHALDPAGVHRWRPMAPCARVEVSLDRPALRWSGRAYLDSNRGDAPLEEAFDQWHWSRSALPDGSAAVLYDVRRRDGTAFGLARHFGSGGGVRDFDPPAPVSLARTLWRVDRAARVDPGGVPDLRRTLEDTPFYTRSHLEGHLLGEPVQTVHESLSLRRFSQRWVQCLLPFRMPRRVG